MDNVDDVAYGDEPNYNQDEYDDNYDEVEEEDFQSPSASHRRSGDDNRKIEKGAILRGHSGSPDTIPH
jgi:hypothetical protein